MQHRSNAAWPKRVCIGDNTRNAQSPIYGTGVGGKASGIGLVLLMSRSIVNEQMRRRETGDDVDWRIK
jgi:nitrate reductase gamma subunit